MKRKTKTQIADLQQQIDQLRRRRIIDLDLSVPTYPWYLPVITTDGTKI